MYSQIAGVRYTIVRPANVYGVGNRLNVGQGVIGVLAHRALKGEQLEVWGTGESRRDYVYIDDLVSALTALIEYNGSETVFNVSSGKAHSVLEVIDELRAILGELPPVVHLPSRGYDVPLNLLSSARLTAATGWSPHVTLESGIPRLIEWIRATQIPEKHSL